MKSFALLSTAILASVVLAQPKHLAAHKALHEKRDVQYMTVTDYSTDIIIEYTTLTLSPGEVAPATVPAAVSTAAVNNENNVANFFQPPAAPESSSQTSLTTAPSVMPHNTEAAVYQPSTTFSTVPTVAAPSSVYSPPPASSAASSAAPESSSSSASSSSSGSMLSYSFSKPSGAGGSLVTDCTSEACTGFATFYDVSDSMSCGYSPIDASQHVIALPVDWMHNPGNSGTNSPIDPNCNRVVSITCASTGTTIQAIVVDSCQACIPGTGHIDLSRGAYDALGVSESVGTPAISWQFMN